MPEIQDLAPTHLADQLERGFRGGAWHGLAMMEILETVDAARAQWRPGPTGYSIAELVGHLTYWLEDTRRRINGELRPQGEPGSDWGDPRTDAETWRAACAALEEAHGRLRVTVLMLPETRLDENLPGSDTTLRGLLLGTLQHNAYHAGQIALLRKLAEAAAGGLS
jgi:uncharacterized damage-inducible protein DinB